MDHKEAFASNKSIEFPKKVVVQIYLIDTSLHGGGDGHGGAGGAHALVLGVRGVDLGLLSPRRAGELPMETIEEFLELALYVRRGSTAVAALPYLARSSTGECFFFCSCTCVPNAIVNRF